MGLSDYNLSLPLKVLLVGDKEVGKGEILRQLSEDNPANEPFINQISIDFKVRNLTLDDGKILKLHLWYTPEIENIRSLSRVYFKNTRIILLCIDLTSQNIYENIARLHDYCQEHAIKYTSYIIIGETSKIGRKNIKGEPATRCFTAEEGKALAEKMNAESYCELSTITGEGCKEILLTIANYGIKLPAILSSSEKQDDIKTAQMAIDKALHGSDSIGSLPMLKPYWNAEIDEELHRKLMEMLLKAINKENYINAKFSSEHQTLLAYYLAKTLQGFLKYESTWLKLFKKTKLKVDLTRETALETSLNYAIYDYLDSLNSRQIGFHP